MSWTETFPVLDDDMVRAYEAGVSAAERIQYDEWFAVERVINRSKAGHLVVFSLFWKNIKSDEPDLPPLDREMLKTAVEKGLVERFAPWDHYVQPLLDGAALLRTKRPDVGIRIYLAADMHFLVEDFTALGCEVCLMKTSSLRHNPGAMWRFLALEERKRLVTIADSDRALEVERDVGRTELMAKSGLGFWRVPVWGELNDVGMVSYRPIFACHLGSAKPHPSRQLMKALVWHTEQGKMRIHANLPGCGDREIYGTKWPDYGYDEWFLLAAIFPRAARSGMLSFIPAEARSRLLPLDIEYCTWASPKSEINFFGGYRGCCGAADGNPVIDEASDIKPLVDSSRWLIFESYGLTDKHPLPAEARRARPDDVEVNGKVLGWMNPSVCQWSGKRWLAYRTECHPVFQWSRVSLANLDAAGSVIVGSNHLLSLPTQFGEWGAEDPRLFVHESRMFLSYTDGWSMGLAELDHGGQIISAKMIEGPKVGARKKEKNWGFFSHDHQLHVDYWCDPHTVSIFDLEKWQRTRSWTTEWSNPIENAEFHGGSNPVLHDGKMWRLIHYRKYPADLRYIVHMATFTSAAPFEMLALSNCPLFVAEPERNRYRGQTNAHVIFASSLERTETGWRVMAGINDHQIAHLEVSDGELDDRWNEGA